MLNSFGHRHLPLALISLLGCDTEPDSAADASSLLAWELPLLSADDACPPAERFGEGILSTASDEGRISFSANGKTAYFHRQNEDNLLELMVSHRRGRQWSTPETLPFSGAFDDLDAFVAGRSLLFASNRPLPDGSSNGDFNLWSVQRHGNAWGEPIPLPSTVNSPASELFPSLTSDGTLYFNSDREGGFGAWDIYTSSRVGGHWLAAENLGPNVNTEAWEFNPAPSPDGSIMFFASMLRADHQDPDIYATVQMFNEWAPSWNLGPCVNTSSGEYHPSLAPDGRSLFFIRSTDETLGDFYRISLD